MNFNPNFFGPVNVNPPIIHRRVRDINRVFVTEQPHIIEDQTRIFNHHILRHTCCVRPSCSEFNSFSEENCCNIPLPGPGCGVPGCGVPGVGPGPIGQGPVGPGFCPGPNFRPRPR